MCVVSMVHDHANTILPQYDPLTWSIGSDSVRIDALEREIKNIKELLRKAEIYDYENDQPDCPDEEKIQALKDLCNSLGIDPSELIDE